MRYTSIAGPRIVVCVVGILFVLPNALRAGDRYWNSLNGDWSDASKWSGGIPGYGDVAYVDNNGTVQVTQNGAVFDTLYLGYTAGHSGNITQTAGSSQVVVRQLAATYGSTGTYSLADGYCYSAYASIGSRGTGTFTQTGGRHEVLRMLALGYQWQSTGTYNLLGGSLEIHRNEGPSYMRVGDASRPYVGGSGTLNIGNAIATGIISEIGSSALPPVDMVVRYTTAESGVVRGWGTIGLKGKLENNGRVIADGYGTDRLLDLSTFSSTANGVSNLTWQNYGWFAQDHGKLALPAISVGTGSNTYNWGEAASDSEIDLVNSARIAFNDVTKSAPLTITLLATDRSDTHLGSGNRIIGLWDASTSGLTFDRATLAFRYDSVAAASLGISESDLKVFNFDGISWTELPSTVDTANHRITASATAFSTLAVGTVVPEPTTISLLSFGGLILVVLYWTRRKRERLERLGSERT